MNKTILIVDDSESIRTLVGSTLESEGYTVIKGENGQDALDKLENNSVSLVITDVNMPVMDGITLVKNLREKEELQHTPILVLTTESQPAKKEEARKLGATGWIVKPFDKERLLNIIKKVMR